MSGTIYTFVQVLSFIELVDAMSSHVCAKQSLQTYSLDYDRAFICPERYTTACGQLDWRRCTKYRSTLWTTIGCPERYTTACGQLDWRRCTKYRVSTCYTPTQRYATRYVTVEVCCPGWRGDTCSEPICESRCQNGGLCSDLGGHPGCRCTEGYYGDDCSQGRNQSDAIEIVLACCAGLVTVVVIVIAVLLYRRRNPSRISPAAPYTIPTDHRLGTRPQDIHHFEQRAVPSAPQLNT